MVDKQDDKMTGNAIVAQTQHGYSRKELNDTPLLYGVLARQSWFNYVVTLMITS